MIIKSYSKINLSLRIIKKLKNGLHDIHSNVFLISLHDNIIIKKINKKKDIIIFNGKFNKNIKKNNNSVVKTLKILRKLKVIINQRYKIIINKKIPIFAGLGGGTSNSAFLIKYFLRKNPNLKTIKIFEKIIGSDLKLFFNNQSYQKNLKKIIRYKKKFIFYFLLVYPNIKCATKVIYSSLKKNKKVSRLFEYKNIRSQTNFMKLIIQDCNDLQETVEKKHPVIKGIISSIKNQNGCKISRLTGSGSVCFGLFQSKKTANSALYKIKRKFPDYWSIVTKTI